MHGLLQILPLLLLFNSRVTSGDLIAIKKGNDVVACLTNNYASAVAFVKKPDDSKDFTQVDYLDGKGGPVPLHKYDCDLVTGNCSHWNWNKRNSQGWSLSREVGDPITDFRWNDFPTYFSNRSSQYQTYKIGQNAPFHFSILEKKNDQGGNKWTSHTVETVVSKNFTFNLESEAQQHIMHFKRSACNDQHCKLTLISNGPGIFKIHEFNQLIPNSGYSYMELELPKGAEGFCVDVVFFCSNVNIRAFDLAITQGTKLLQNFAQLADRAIGGKWVTRRFENKTLNVDGKWKVRLTAGTDRIKIGGIKFCAGGDFIVKPKGKNMESCHLLAANDSMSTTMKRVREVANDKTICGALGEDCSELSACRESGECIVFTGLTRKKHAKSTSLTQITSRKTTTVMIATETSSTTKLRDFQGTKDSPESSVSQKTNKVGISDELHHIYLIICNMVSFTMFLMIMCLFLRMKTVENSIKKFKRELQNIPDSANLELNAVTSEPDDHIYDDVGPY
ncbi:uncharacterized protein LOC135939579 [Cloeon dipterum]|uniref:uncharacterized protein LOC135939579 n=1 Tax=Cloeon dipterum TaxID=197152 RepID=UPI0032207E17